jgi:hypothetical protein
MPTDEHGEPIPLDGTRPPDVVTHEQAARWDLCVQIAERITQQQDPHYEVMSFARVLYDSPRATTDGSEESS